MVVKEREEAAKERKGLQQELETARAQTRLAALRAKLGAGISSS